MCKPEHPDRCGKRATSSMHKSQLQANFTTRYCGCQGNSSMYLRKEHFVHHHSRSKKISRMCRKIKQPPYFLSVRAFNPCTLTTEYPSGREIQQPRTVCDDRLPPPVCADSPRASMTRCSAASRGRQRWKTKSGADRHGNNSVPQRADSP